MLATSLVIAASIVRRGSTAPVQEVLRPTGAFAGERPKELVVYTFRLYNFKFHVKELHIYVMRAWEHLMFSLMFS